MFIKLWILQLCVRQTCHHLLWQGNDSDFKGPIRWWFEMFGLQIATLWSWEKTSNSFDKTIFPLKFLILKFFTLSWKQWDFNVKTGETHCQEFQNQVSQLLIIFILWIDGKEQFLALIECFIFTGNSSIWIVELLRTRYNSRQRSLLLRLLWKTKTQCHIEQRQIRYRFKISRHATTS